MKLQDVIQIVKASYASHQSAVQNVYDAMNEVGGGCTYARAYDLVATANAKIQADAIRAWNAETPLGQMYDGQGDEVEQ